MKVNTSLCMGIANQWEDDDTVILSQGSLGCHQASPRCVDHSLSGSAANWHHLPSPHVGHRKNLPTSEGSSMTCSTIVALRGSCGVSTVPLTNPPPEHHTIFSRASTESQATKSSRRWQPPRVTSTTGLQLDHLVPLDATSRCNHTRITHSLDRMITIKQSELEGSQAHLHKPPRLKGAQQPAQG
jgi:hypothetical protein